jgi:mannose-6-phosphate isomerase-like protein (cupin superfamily)
MPVTTRSTAEHYTWGDACDGWRHLALEELSVIEERIPPGRGEVAHFHDRARQLFYVLSGRLALETAGEVVEIAGGESFEVPPAVVHRVHNPFADDAVFLVISCPSTTRDRTNV